MVSSSSWWVRRNADREWSPSRVLVVVSPAARRGDGGRRTSPAGFTPHGGSRLQEGVVYRSVVEDAVPANFRGGLLSFQEGRLYYIVTRIIEGGHTRGAVFSNCLGAML